MDYTLATMDSCSSETRFASSVSALHEKTRITRAVLT